MLNDNDSSNLASQLSNDASTRHSVKMGILEKKRFMLLFSMLKPKVSIDGNQYCVLYGSNLQEGIAGFGDTLMKAIDDFNKQFNSPIKLKDNL